MRYQLARESVRTPGSTLWCVVMDLGISLVQLAAWAFRLTGHRELADTLRTAVLDDLERTLTEAVAAVQQP